MVKLKCKECRFEIEFDEEKSKDLSFFICDRCGNFVKNPFHSEDKIPGYIQ